MKNIGKQLFFSLMIFLGTIVSAQQNDTLYLYFELNESELSQQELSKFNTFCEAKTKNTIEIIIAAYADSTGSLAANQILSSNRMDLVKRHLVNTNTSFKNIVKASAMGETVKYGPDLQQNRCVELIFISQEKKGINNLSAYAKGEKIVLENILFQNNTHILLPSSLAALQALLETLKANPMIRIMIQGHVCCGGNNPDYDMIEPGSNNMKISETRAKAVCDYLIENGIENDRLKYMGLSFKHPRVFPETSEEDSAKNRRVEIEIL